MSIRPSLRVLTALLAVALTLTLGACAAATSSGAEAGASGAGNTTLRVQNNLLPASTLTIHTVTDAGVRRTLGTVQPGATTTFRFDVQTGDRLRFEATPQTGKVVQTTALTLSPGRTLRWDVNANAIR